MVRGYDNAELAKRGIRSVSKRVFLQRWTELLHPQTIDTYRAKLMNAHLILNELEQVAQLALEDERADLHLVAVWNEAQKIVRHDDLVLQRRARRLRQALDEFFKHGPRTRDPRHISRMLLDLSVLRPQVGQNYKRWVLETLQEAFASDDVRAAETLSGALASELLVSRDARSLYYLGDRLLKESFDRNWSKFERLVLDQGKSMRVFIPFSGDPVELRRRAGQLGLTFVPSEAISQEPPMPRWFAVIEVMAQDIQTAAARAAAEVEQRLNVVSLFIDPGSRTLDWAIVRYETAEGPRKARVSLRRWKPESDRTRALATMLDVLASEIEAVSRTRLLDAIEYAQLARTSQSTGNRFLGNWVALETLTRSPRQRVIECITTYVPAVLCNQYVYKLCNNFIEDCARCGVDFGSTIGVSAADRSSAVRQLLLCAQSQTEREQIVRACSGHDALALRAQQLLQRLSSGPEVKRLLEEHHQRLYWHLLRLYRIRNSIVHAGRTPEIAEACIPHLEEYVYRVITETAFRMRTTNIRDIPQVLALTHYSHLTLVHEMGRCGNYDPALHLDQVFELLAV